MALLEFNDVSFSYPDADRPTLKDVSFVLESGQFVALLGANGSGKSTLAKIAAGLIDPQAGEVKIETGTINGDSENPKSAAWNGVGMLFQNPDEQLLTEDVVSELAWGLENLCLPPDEIDRRVKRALKFFNLTDKAHTPPESLSDGQKQLVALAAIAVMRPSFFILDEATAFLDPYWTEKVRQYVRKMASDTGIMWITTRTRDVLSAERVLLMHDGRITADGNPRDVLKPELLDRAGVECLEVL